jgi:hypothetical protein
MNDLTEREKNARDTLGYTSEWIDAGVLDSATLMEQFERFGSGGTQKTAKYRAQTVTAWLAEGPSLSNEQIDAFLAVMNADSDAKLSHAAIVELIQSTRIDLEKLERIARFDEKLMRRHAALIRRTFLMRQMQSGVTDDHMAQMIEYKDAAVQTSLIHDARLTRKHAELLAERGANPTIREKARKWAQDKAFWKGKTAG